MSNICYIKSATDFSTKDIFQFDTYSISHDIEYAEKTEFVAANKPNIQNDDFVILKSGSDTMFFGICENYSSDESSGYTIELKQAECLFDRQIFPGNQALIKTTGIEDFIRSEIMANWISSGDALLDKTYITVVASTHTRINATVNAENGVYNLKTFLGNAKEYYGIFTDFSFTDSVLTITIRKDTSPELPIDVTICDVTQYSETYNVDVLAKLFVKWYNKTSETTTTSTYYLKTDRTITTNGSDPDRAEGIVKSIYIEKDTSAEAYQEVLNEFSSNSYEHKITFDLSGNSLAYPVANYYVGRKVSIKTKTGIKSSIITGLSHSSDSSFYSFVFGKLKITLIDKIRSLGR